MKRILVTVLLAGVLGLGKAEAMSFYMSKDVGPSQYLRATLQVFVQEKGRAPADWRELDRFFASDGDTIAPDAELPSSGLKNLNEMVNRGLGGSVESNYLLISDGSIRLTAAETGQGEGTLVVIGAHPLSDMWWLFPNVRRRVFYLSDPRAVMMTEIAEETMKSVFARAHRELPMETALYSPLPEREGMRTVVIFWFVACVCVVRAGLGWTRLMKASEYVRLSLS